MLIPCSAELFGHRIPAPILFAPIGINKLYSPEGELVPAKIAGELGLPVCQQPLIPSFLGAVLTCCISIVFQRPDPNLSRT